MAGKGDREAGCDTVASGVPGWTVLFLSPVLVSDRLGEVTTVVMESAVAW